MVDGIGQITCILILSQTWRVPSRFSARLWRQQEGAGRLHSGDGRRQWWHHLQRRSVSIIKLTAPLVLRSMRESKSSQSRFSCLFTGVVVVPISWYFYEIYSSIIELKSDGPIFVLQDKSERSIIELKSDEPIFCLAGQIWMQHNWAKVSRTYVEINGSIIELKSRGPMFCFTGRIWTRSTAASLSSSLADLCFVFSGRIWTR